jgi:hypothetical protein
MKGGIIMPLESIIARVTDILRLEMHNAYLELVPSADWRERALASLPPKPFWSVKAKCVLGGIPINVSANLNATDAEGEIRGLGIERTTLDGRACEQVPSDSDAFAQFLPAAGGKPVFTDTSLPYNVQLAYGVKRHFFTTNEKTLVLLNAKLAYDDKGNPWAHAQYSGVEIIDTPRFVPTGEKLNLGECPIQAPRAKRPNVPTEMPV